MHILKQYILYNSMHNIFQLHIKMHIKPVVNKKMANLNRYIFLKAI